MKRLSSMFVYYFQKVDVSKRVTFSNHWQCSAYGCGDYLSPRAKAVLTNIVSERRQKRHRLAYVEYHDRDDIGADERFYGFIVCWKDQVWVYLNRIIQSHHRRAIIVDSGPGVTIRRRRYLPYDFKERRRIRIGRQIQAQVAAVSGVPPPSESYVKHRLLFNSNSRIYSIIARFFTVYWVNEQGVTHCLAAVPGQIWMSAWKRRKEKPTPAAVLSHVLHIPRKVAERWAKNPEAITEKEFRREKALTALAG